jgi:hypothetical protein
MTSLRSLPPVTLRSIHLQDLKDTGRLLDLYTQAVHEGFIGSSEADRLTFVGLAHHVLRYRPDNAGGLFRRLLQQRHFHFVTQEDEDMARRCLKYYLYEGGLSVPWHATG